jgi:shikimate 5-dehydrogenase
MAKNQCEEALAALIRERTGAVADGLEMLVANLDGQIVAELKRWDEVRDAVLAAHPEIRIVWEESSK